MMFAHVAHNYVTLTIGRKLAFEMAADPTRAVDARWDSHRAYLFGLSRISMDRLIRIASWQLSDQAVERRRKRK